MSSKKKTKPAIEALDMQAPIEESPESAKQAPLIMTMSEEEARNWQPEPVDPDKVMADEYAKCGSSIPDLLRAILRELVIARCTHGH